MLDPDQGRMTVWEKGDALQIRVPAKLRILVTAFVGFWLVGWAFGWITAAGSLFSETGAVSIFLLAWLGAWTAGGIAALSFSLWTVAGEEWVEVTNQNTTLTRRIRGCKRQWVCETARMSPLRAVENEGPFPVNSRQRHGLWAARSEGALKFACGVHTIGFALNVDHAEASQALSLIRKRFPHLREPQQK